MVGAVGRDAEGQEMLQALRAAGVLVDDIAEATAETGTALIIVDSAGENQIAVCEGANAEVSLDGVEFGEDETVLTQLEISMDLITELAARVPGHLVINAAPALPLPAEVVDRADLIIVNETEYSLLPQLQEARLVAVTYGDRGSALLAHGEQIGFAEALARRAGEHRRCRRRLLRRPDHRAALGTARRRGIACGQPRRSRDGHGCLRAAGVPHARPLPRQLDPYPRRDER
jgi:sugar/nucleoside kinase (ribokinase family)